MPGLPLGKKVVTYQRQRVGTKQAVIGLSFSPELLGKLLRASFLGRVTSVFMFTLLFHCAFRLPRSQNYPLELIWFIVLETLIYASVFESNLLWKASGTGRGFEPYICPFSDPWTLS